MLTSQQKMFFDTFGFLIIRGFFSKDEVKAISNEFNTRAQIASDYEPFDGTKRQTIDMSGSDSPFFASLLDDERLLSIGKDIHENVLPWGTHIDRHVNNTYWHHDAGGYEWYGIKFAFYLDELKANSGALRVIPGSHKQPFHDELDNIKNLKYSWIRQNYNAASESSFISPIPSYSCESNPGDLVIFDYRIFHASLGGSKDRHMCTVNFINYPKTPKQLAISIHEAKNYFKDNHNTGAPWNPSKAVSEEWLANPNHNPDRQRGIDQWVRLSKMKVSDTGYKVVTNEGKLQVIPI